MTHDIDALAALSITAVRTSAEELGRLKGWNVASAKGLISCLPMIVRHVEDVGEIKELTGAEKQAFAVAIILKLIKLPWWLPVSIVRPLLEGAVNAVVSAINDR